MPVLACMRNTVNKPPALRPSRSQGQHGVARIKKQSPNRLQWQFAGLVAVVLGYVAHFRLLDGRIQDDAYISFRYARHFAEGKGLVWNVGERVEGYTNFLWTLLMSLPMFISDKLAPMDFARAVSSLSGYVTIILSFVIGRHMLPKTRVLPLVAPILLAGSWPLAINTMTGLETVFFGALLTGATLLLIREQDELRDQGSSVVYALAALTRPEAIGLSLLSFGLVAAYRFGEGKPAKDYLQRLLLPFVAIVGAHEVFRLAYYGEWVPNTYFAKFGAELPEGMPTRASYLQDFFFTNLSYPVGIMLLLMIPLLLTKRRHLPSMLIVIAAAYGVLNVVLSGADFMIGFRYLVPYLPFWVLAGSLGFGAFLEQKSPKKGNPKAEWFLAVASMALALTGYFHSRDKLRSFENLRYRVNADSNTILGKWLADSLPKDAVIVARDIGEIGYSSDLTMIDMTGLTDKTIARKPGNVLDRAVNVDEIFARNPTAFVFISKLPGPVNGPRRAMAYASPKSTLALLDDPRLQEQFVFHARYPQYDRLRQAADGSWIPVSRQDAQRNDFPNTYFLEVYLRKDASAAVQK